MTGIYPRHDREGLPGVGHACRTCACLQPSITVRDTIRFDTVFRGPGNPTDRAADYRDTGCGDPRVRGQMPADCPHGGMSTLRSHAGGLHC
jgi:hypothetical protein